jgi:excisionase family DNA binding protein
MGTTQELKTQRVRNLPTSPLLTIDGVAEAMNVTRRLVQRLVAERRIPFLKVGRFVRFDPTALNAWLEEQQVDPVRRAGQGRTGSR